MARRRVLVYAVAVAPVLLAIDRLVYGGPEPSFYGMVPAVGALILVAAAARRWARG